MRDKRFANRGVRRNKKPLKNIEYWIKFQQLKEDVNVEEYESFLFEGKGYIVLRWRLQNNKNPFPWNFHGFVTKDYVKQRLTTKQYSDFCQGKRYKFIIQRRVDGKNI